MTTWPLVDYQLWSVLKMLGQRNYFFLESLSSEWPSFNFSFSRRRFRSFSFRIRLSSSVSPGLPIYESKADLEIHDILCGISFWQFSAVNIKFWVQYSGLKSLDLGNPNPRHRQKNFRELSLGLRRDFLRLLNPEFFPRHFRHQNQLVFLGDRFRLLRMTVSRKLIAKGCWLGLLEDFE